MQRDVEEVLRARILAHPVITTMDKGHQDRVRIALEGAGFKVGCALIRRQERQRVEPLRQAASTFLDAADRVFLSWPTADPADRLHQETYQLAKSILRAALDSSEDGVVES